MLHFDPHMEVNMGKERPMELILRLSPSDAQHHLLRK